MAFRSNYDKHNRHDTTWKYLLAIFANLAFPILMAGVGATAFLVAPLFLSDLAPTEELSWRILSSDTVGWMLARMAAGAVVGVIVAGGIMLQYRRHKSRDDDTNDRNVASPSSRKSRQSTT